MDHKKNVQACLLLLLGYTDILLRKTVGLYVSKEDAGQQKDKDSKHVYLIRPEMLVVRPVDGDHESSPGRLSILPLSLVRGSLLESIHGRPTDHRCLVRRLVAGIRPLRPFRVWKGHFVDHHACGLVDLEASQRGSL